MQCVFQHSKHVPVIPLMEYTVFPFKIIGLILLPFMFLRILTLTSVREEQSVLCLFSLTWSRNRKHFNFILPRNQ